MNKGRNNNTRRRRWQTVQ